LPPTLNLTSNRSWLTRADGAAAKVCDAAVLPLAGEFARLNAV
jgi:hypothetical protein